MIFAIGITGQAVRIFFDAISIADAELQCTDGEIAVAADHIRTGGIIGETTVVYADPTLDDIKAARWEQAKTVRTLKMASFCSTPAGIVDCDDDSQRKISGASTAAIAAKVSGSGFSVDWTMRDNTIVTLDADDMIAMGLAVMTFQAACQNAGTAIRDAIAAAVDAEAVAAIDITSGYPS